MLTSMAYREQRLHLNVISGAILVAASLTLAALPGWAQSAVRSLPDTYTPEQPVSVSITVTPPADVEWYAIEHHPAGWTVSNITQGGNWSSSDNSIIWPSFLNGDMRTLTYEATPPAGETGTKAFDGSATFLTNGTNTIQITGDTTILKDLGLPKVDTPTFSPDPSPVTDFSGKNLVSVTISISTLTPESTIRYTIGYGSAPSDPDETTGAYLGPISNLVIKPKQTVYLKAKAWRDSWPPSDVAFAEYYHAGELNDSWLNTSKVSKSAITEEILPPLSKNQRLSPNDALGVRLSVATEIDPDSVWAEVNASTGSVDAQYQWRVVSVDATDTGWVVVTPESAWPVGDTLSVTVGGLTLSGSAVGPVTELFTVSAEKSAATDEGPPYLVEDEAITPLPSLIADAVSPVYRIGPSGVFDDPTGVWVPVPAGESADDLDIYYYSESERHTGWFKGENVDGWLVPKNTYVVVQDGQTYLYFEVNHSGVFQLARTTTVKLGSLASVDVGAAGSCKEWLASATVLLALLAAGLAGRNRVNKTPGASPQ